MLASKNLSLVNARVLDDAGVLSDIPVHVADGAISASPPHGGTTIDCSGLYVLPGIVDVHGDAFERELHPRPGVDIAFNIAMQSVDRQLIANGITTAYHGLTMSWEPGERSHDVGVRFMDALAAARSGFVSDHRVQIRWETFAADCIDTVVGWLDGDVPVALAFNDHTTSTLTKVAAGENKKLAQWASRAGLSPDAYLERVQDVAKLAPDVPAMVARVAAAARARGAVMLSHDDRTLADREFYRELGTNVCEFPLTREAALDAQAHGQPSVLGGPNVVRGGSHTGALSAEAAVREELCSVLASDYYYPSLFHAVLRLVRSSALDLPAAWALVSRNPAAAMQLDDRGVIAPSKRADLVIADIDGDRGIVATVANGRISWFGA